ncbi:MAG: TonB-dependent receptor, partial [Flavobacterium sp.]|nr:TonB-dependent receptor [Flavobacterium sp.]
MKSFLLTLILWFSIVANAQNKVIGIVTDSQNKPISGVNISIPEIHKETISDADGKYQLINLPNGNFKIIFSHIGFATQSKDFSSKEKTNTINVTLAETAHQMDEVIISTVFNKLQSQNVMKVEHESVKSMQQKGATTLIEGLATIPGVSQVSTGVSIGKPVIRGLSGNRVLVYSQGVRLENQAFGDEHGLGLNDSGVDGVEVIKGPASLLYGSDALGGVLYFIPEKFAKADTFGVDFGQKYFSNTLGSSTNIGAKGSTDQFKFLTRVNYTRHSDYKIASPVQSSTSSPDGNRVTNTRYNELDFKTGIGYSDSNFSSEFRYNYNRILLGIPEEGIAEQTNEKTPAYPRQAVYNQLLSLNNTVFLGKTKLDLNLGYIYNDRAEFPVSAIPGSNWHLKTLNYDTKFHLPKTTKLETIIGVQGMHQINLNVGNEYLIPDATTKDIGAFGTTRYEFGTNVLQAGIRYDVRKIIGVEHLNFGDVGYLAPIDRKFNSFNASLGYKTSITEATILRLNVASGFRAPNIFELSSNGVHDGTIRFEIGNPNLKSEQNFQTDLNLEYKNSHFEVFVNGFY